MDIKTIHAQLSVSPQISAADVATLAQAGFKSIICNRPDGEAGDQPSHQEIEAAAVAAGLNFRYLPAETGKVQDEHGTQFGELMQALPGPVLAYCRTGTRSTTMWALSQSNSMNLADIIETAGKAGYDLKGLARRILNGGKTPTQVVDAEHDVVIIGGGAGGISVASSILARNPNVDIAIIEPADVHYYQPGWTMVGGGIFDAKTTAKAMSSVLPSGVRWIKAAVAAFEPEQNCVVLDGCRLVKYAQLVVAPGLKLDWNAIPGLSETLGKNGVTSNYRYDLAPYTWKLVQETKRGDAIFTQPPMPIKCAGAPQKAMYLSSDHWRRQGVLGNMNIQFCNAGGVLFGVSEYVPALMEYVKAYGIHLQFSHNLVSIDGEAHEATFSVAKPDGSKETVTKHFDMIHVVPPQKAPDFIRVSPLADAAGWVDVDPATLCHKKYPNIHALGDTTNTTNAKTAAAARAQAPVVAHNVLSNMGHTKGKAKYNGYGSCPLTVERGKIVLAEFLYGGKVAPTFPSWLIDGQQPSRLAWLLKERILPPVYWGAMLKGREWLVSPEMEG